MKDVTKNVAPDPNFRETSPGRYKRDYKPSMIAFFEHAMCLYGV